MVEDIMLAALRFVATVAVLLVAGYALPWLKARVGVERLALLTGFAREAYSLVEANAPKLVAAGLDKLETATEYVNEWLKERGVTVSVAQIKAAIEQAWRDLDPKSPTNTK